MDKTKIIEAIEESLSKVYCNNCHSRELDMDDEECNCEDCHRKYMGWEISNKAAEEIANKILKIESEEK